MILSILIPTVEGREAQCAALVDYLNLQKVEGVEIITLKDNKEMSIGQKRQKLYELAKGKYSVQIDDDDSVDKDYIKLVLNALKENPDCVGYYERCLIDGEVRKSVFSKECFGWITFQNPKDGIYYHRTPFFKSPIKTELCLKVGVRDMRFAEDHDFANRMHQYLKKEYFIYKEMYFYSANSLTTKEHNERYGIKN